MDDYDDLNSDQILARMRSYARDAREGVNVRHSERHLRWLFEAFDRRISDGMDTIPEAWDRR